MNRLTKAITVGVIAGTIHNAILLVKGMSFYTLAAVFIQYLIGSLLIFYVPLKIKGLMKGLSVGVLCAVPLLIPILRFEMYSSIVSGILLFSLISSMMGLYQSYEREVIHDLTSLDKLQKALLAGALGGVINAVIMPFVGMSLYSIVSIFLQYITCCVLIFYAPGKMMGLLKGFLLSFICALPLVLLVTRHDPINSAITLLIMFSLYGALVGFYSTYRESK